MKSLKLHRCRQIAEPRKYCLMCVIVFFGVCFLFFFFFFFLFLTGWELGIIPYTMLQLFLFVMDIPNSYFVLNIIYILLSFCLSFFFLFFFFFFFKYHCNRIAMRNKKGYSKGQGHQDQLQVVTTNTEFITGDTCR